MVEDSLSLTRPAVTSVIVITVLTYSIIVTGVGPMWRHEGPTVCPCASTSHAVTAAPGVKWNDHSNSCGYIEIKYLYSVSLPVHQPEAVACLLTSEPWGVSFINQKALCVSILVSFELFKYSFGILILPGNYLEIMIVYFSFLVHKLKIITMS